MIWWNDQQPLIERLNQHHANTLASRLGIEFIDCGDDWIKARMPVDERTVQPFGRLHGGASVALAESVGSMAAGLCVDPALFSAVGLEINANHVRPAHAGWVFATAKPEALGRTTQVWTIRIEDEAGKLVCISRLTMAVIPQTRM